MIITTSRCIRLANEHRISNIGIVNCGSIKSGSRIGQTLCDCDTGIRLVKPAHRPGSWGCSSQCRRLRGTYVLRSHICKFRNYHCPADFIIERTLISHTIWQDEMSCKLVGPMGKDKIRQGNMYGIHGGQRTNPGNSHRISLVNRITYR